MKSNNLKRCNFYDIKYFQNKLPMFSYLTKAKQVFKSPDESFGTTLAKGFTITIPRKKDLCLNRTTVCRTSFKIVTEKRFMQTYWKRSRQFELQLFKYLSQFKVKLSSG